MMQFREQHEQEPEKQTEQAQDTTRALKILKNLVRKNTYTEPQSEEVSKNNNLFALNKELAIVTKKYLVVYDDTKDLYMIAAHSALNQPNSSNLKGNTLPKDISRDPRLVRNTIIELIKINNLTDPIIEDIMKQIKKINSGYVQTARGHISNLDENEKLNAAFWLLESKKLDIH